MVFILCFDFLIACTLQRILEGVEKRSKTLGISNMSKLPLAEYNDVVESTPKAVTKSVSRRRSSERKQSNDTAHHLVTARTTSDQTTAFNIDAKENCDLALEINITTGPNVQVNTFN